MKLYPSDSSYRWLANTQNRRPAHVFVNGLHESLCTNATRHELAMANWQPDAARPHCHNCERELDRDHNSHLQEVVAQ